MMNESNVNMNCLTTHKVPLDLDSDNDDCYTSISQCPVNPLSLIPNGNNNDIALPSVTMLAYDGFWKKQQNEEITEVTSSAGTFSAETTSKHPITFTKWYPVINGYDLQITGVTLNGCIDSRTVGKRIARYIFYDNSETACSLVGPMSVSDGQPEFIQQKFLYGIPEDWTTIRLLWIEYKSQNSPNDFIWSAETDLDSESTDSNVSVNLRRKIDINDMELTNIHEHPVFSTPQNNTNCFYNITEISKINNADLTGTFQQKLFKNNTRNRSVKKAYSTALLKRKLRKYETMLKVSLMRECPTLESVDHIPEYSSIQEETQNNFQIGDHATSQHETMPKLQNMSQKVVNQIIKLPASHNSNHRLQSTLSNETIKCHQLINISPTSQFQMRAFSKLQMTKEHDFGVESAENSSLVSQNNVGKPASCRSSNMSALRLTSPTPEEKISSLKTADEVSKLQNAVKPNVADGNNVIVQEVLINNHHDSKPVLKNKSDKCNRYKAIENELDESVSSNTETYPNNSNSVVISLYKNSKLNLMSQINKPCTSKSNPSVNNNVSRFPRRTINVFENVMENDSEESIIRRRKLQDDSSEDDSIFMCKKSDNTNKQRLKTMCSKSIVTREGEIFARNLPLKIDVSKNNEQVITKNAKKKKPSELVESDENFNLHQDTKIVTQKATRSNTSNSIISDKGVYNNEKRKAVKRFQIGRSSSDIKDMEYSNHNIIADIVVHRASNIIDNEISNCQLEKRNQNISRDESIGSLTKVQAKICDNAKENKRSRSQNNTFLKERMENFKIFKEAEMETNDTFTDGSNTKIGTPQKKNNNCLKRRPKKIETKRTNREKSHDENNDSCNLCNNKINQETKQFSLSDKHSTNLKISAQQSSSLQINNSVFSKKTVDFDQSELYLSRRGRVRCTTLPFWTGGRLKTIGDETIITNDSMTNSINKNCEYQKLLLTTQNVSSVGEKYRMKIPLKSPIRNLENTKSNLKDANDPEAKNIINWKLERTIKKNNSIKHNNKQINITDEHDRRRTRSQTRNKSIISQKKSLENPPPNSNQIPSDFLNDNSSELIKHNVKDISKKYPDLKNGIIYSSKDNIKYRNLVEMSKAKSKNEILTLSSCNKSLKNPKNELLTLSYNKNEDNMPEHVQGSQMDALKQPKCRRSRSTIEKNKLTNNCDNEKGQLIRNLETGNISDFAEEIFNSVHTPKLNIKEYELVANHSEINQRMVATTNTNVGKRTTANVAKQLKCATVKDNTENISDSSEVENIGDLDILERFDCMVETSDKVTRIYDKCPLNINSSKFGKNINSKSCEQKLQERNDKFLLVNSPIFRENDKVAKLCTTDENKANTSKDISNISLVKAINKSKTASLPSSNFLSLERNEYIFENDSNIKIVDYTKPSCGESQKIIESNEMLKVSLDYMENVDSGVEIITNCGHEILETMPSNLQLKKNKKIQCENGNFEKEIVYTNAITKDSISNFNKQETKTRSNKIIGHQNISVDTTNNREKDVSNCKNKVDFDEQKEKKERKSRTKADQGKAKEQSRLCNISTKSKSSISYISVPGSNLSSSYLNTTISSRGRTRIPNLPFWNGSRAHVSEDGVQIIKTTPVSADCINGLNCETHVSFTLQNKLVIRQPPNSNKPKPPTPQSKKLINQNVCPEINRSNVLQHSFQNTREVSNHSTRQKGTYADSNKDEREKNRIPNKKNKKTGSESSYKYNKNSVNSSVTRPNEEKRNCETEDQKLSKDNSFANKSFKFPVSEEPGKKMKNKQVKHKINLKKKCEKNELKDSFEISKTKGQKISERKPNRSKADDKSNEQSDISDNFVRTQIVEKSYENYINTDSFVVRNRLPDDTNKVLIDKRANRAIEKKPKVQRRSKRNLKGIIIDDKESEQNAILDKSVKINTISKLVENVCDNYTNGNCLIVEKTRVERKPNEIISNVKKCDQNLIPDDSIKTNTIFKSAENAYENYTNKNCVVIIKPLPDDIVKHLMKRRSNTVKGKTQRVSKINSTNILKVPALPKKSRKRKLSLENYMNDIQKMSMILKPKKKRTTKDHSSITPNMPTISINSATKKSGKRKLYSEAAWLNSEQFLQSVGEPEKSMPQNFCIQIEQNNVHDDFYDEISEVSAFVKR